MPERRLRISPDHFQRPGTARVWDYWLGGTNNFPIDRATAAEVARSYPRIADVVLSSRRFLTRCVRYLSAEAGIRQFLDIGSGLPTGEDTHDVAQAIDPSTSVVYVDNDPMVLGRAKARSSRHPASGPVFYLGGDVRQPGLVISDARTVLDFGQPVALLLLGVLGHACPTVEEVRRLLDRYRRALCPGSYLVYRTGIDLYDDPRARERSARFCYYLRSPEEFRSCFDGLELVEPGVVAQHLWHPDPGELDVPAPEVWAGVARIG